MSNCIFFCKESYISYQIVWDTLDFPPRFRKYKRRLYWKSNRSKPVDKGCSDTKFFDTHCSANPSCDRSVSFMDN